MSISYTQEDEAKVMEQLIPCWQSLAAIAYRSGLSCQVCKEICVKLYNDGIVRCGRTRLDGVNLVYSFKLIESKIIMGVHMPVGDSSEEHF